MPCSTTVEPVDDNAPIWSIDEAFESVIQPFHLGSPMVLREKLLETGAIISGSAALAMIHTDVFKPNDLDFYVLPAGFSQLLVFIENHGYRPNASDKDCVPYDCDTYLVLTLLHHISWRKINIIIVSNRHVVGAITEFHSTLVMNYVAWYGIVSLYPDWTVEKKGLIIKVTESAEKAFAKYEVRGFKLVKTNKDLISNDEEQIHYCKMEFDCPQKKHSLHDKFCGFQPFQGLESNLKMVDSKVTWTLPVPCAFDT